MTKLHEKVDIIWLYKAGFSITRIVKITKKPEEEILAILTDKTSSATERTVGSIGPKDLYVASERANG